MAATKQIDAMTAATALGGTEEIPGVQSAATVKITATQIKTFTSASPTLVTPVLGVATGTSLGLSGGITTSNLGNTQNQSTISGLKLGTDGNGQVIDSTSAAWSLWRGGQVHVYLYGGNTQFLTQIGLGPTAQAPLAFLSAPAAATFQHGAADAASPVAQTIKFQDVVAGTSNTAGVNATIQAPAGTGTGAGGSLIFQVAAAGSSGTAKNAWATALTIDSTKLATFGGGVTATGKVTASYFRNDANQFHLYGTAGGIELYDSTETLSFALVPGASNLATFNGPIKALTTTVASLPAAGTIGRLAYVTDALAPTFLATVVGGGSVKTPVHDDGTNWVVG